MHAASTIAADVRGAERSVHPAVISFDKTYFGNTGSGGTLVVHALGRLPAAISLKIFGSSPPLSANG
jgi:hypothetical protein